MIIQFDFYAVWDRQQQRGMKYYLDFDSETTNIKRSVVAQTQPDMAASILLAEH